MTANLGWTKLCITGKKLPEFYKFLGRRLRLGGYRPEWGGRIKNLGAQRSGCHQKAGSHTRLLYRDAKTRPQ